MITTTLNDQNHIWENCIGSVIYFFILTEVPFVYMERALFSPLHCSFREVLFLTL